MPYGGILYDLKDDADTMFFARKEGTDKKGRTVAASCNKGESLSGDEELHL